MPPKTSPSHQLAPDLFTPYARKLTVMGQDVELMCSCPHLSRTCCLLRSQLTTAVQDSAGAAPRRLPGHSDRDGHLLQTVRKWEQLCVALSDTLFNAFKSMMISNNPLYCWVFILGVRLCRAEPLFIPDYWCRTQDWPDQRRSGTGPGPGCSREPSLARGGIFLTSWDQQSLASQCEPHNGWTIY